MHLSRLCLTLPSEDAGDLIGSASPPKPTDHHRRRRRRHPFAALRRLCRRRGIFPKSCWCTSLDDDHVDGPQFFEDIPGEKVEAAGAAGHENPRIFSYAELYIGSSGFSDKEILGSGGFGRVYRAVLPSDGSVVAVKCVAGGDRFEEAYAAELMAVVQLRHRNLVRLRGWCVHDQQLLLVYDYMLNRSLDRLLFGKPAATAAPPLGWGRRKRIVAGLAAALFYLHEQLNSQIIHRDVKASNVMLDADYNARLGDFGLARWLEHDSAGVYHLELSKRSPSARATCYQFRLTDTSKIGGTVGYLPPESFEKKGGPVTAKSDVFSFGIVALEVATGRRAVDLAYPDDRIVLLDWVRALADEGNTLNAADSRLPDGSYPLADMRRLIHLGLLCSVHDQQSRPPMKWVMEMLSEKHSGDLPPLPSFKSHRSYIPLLSSTTTTATTGATDTTTTTITTTASDYYSIANSTVFLTADNGGGDLDSSNRSRQDLTTPSIPTVDTPREIAFNEIAAITNNFSEDQMVAELDFGTGYHGILKDRGGVRVLVKWLGLKTCPALRTRFSDELRNLGRLRHRNLVQLRGWCMEQGEMLVVYDYSSCNSLSRHLFHHGTATLPWPRRYGIVKSLASAVLYLHEEWEEQVIHRNITPSAVFLDRDMNPRLGCFALAEFLTRNDHDGHHHPPTASTSPSVRGIFGYMAPEYMQSGEATAMADIYSFGVVVLEVVSGQRAVDFRYPKVLLVKKAQRGRRAAVELADQRLDGKFDVHELRRLVMLGLACTRSDPDRRPCMREIVSILDGNDELLGRIGGKNEGREEWEGRNAGSLAMVRRIQALGIQ